LGHPTKLGEPLAEMEFFCASHNFS